MDRFLLTNASGTPGGAWVPIPLWLRVAVAVVIVVWGARTDRTWTVPIASAIAMPVLWFAGFAILAALVRVPPASPRSRIARPDEPSTTRPGADQRA